MRVTATLLLILVTGGSSSGDDSPPPALSAEVKAALKRNALLFAGVLITGEMARRPLAPIETVLTTFETTESEADFTQPVHFELRFKGPLFRESTGHPPGNAYTHDVLDEISFDGTQYRFGQKTLDDPPNSSVFIYTPRIATEYGKKNHTAECMARMQFWYLRETGFTGPQQLGTLGQPVVSAILRAADQRAMVAVNRVSGGDEILEVVIEQPEPWQSRETFEIETHPVYLQMQNGTDQLQMRMERERRQLAGRQRVIRYLLNGALGYAVQEKWESRKESGETLFHTKNSDFVQVAPNGVFMPRRCVVTSHAYDTAPLLISPEPLYETEIRMNQCVPGELDDDQFRIYYDIPGAEIVDYTSPKATLDKPERLRVPAPIEDLPKPATSRRMGWLLALNILLVVVWIGWLYKRSREKSTKA